MNKGALPQSCNILGIVEMPGDRFHPATQTLVPVISDIQCRLDTLMMADVKDTTTAGVTLVRGGGLLFIDGDYGIGDTREFNEKNFVEIGSWQYNINFIHDVVGFGSIDHYELEVSRRAVGGAK